MTLGQAQAIRESEYKKQLFEALSEEEQEEARLAWSIIDAEEERHTEAVWREEHESELAEIYGLDFYD